MGLINQSAPPEQIEQAGMADDMEPAGVGDDLTPEQEEAYTRFTTAAEKLLYEDGMAKDVGERLLGADDVRQEMANIAYELVAGLDERSGGLLDDELVAPAAFDVLGMIAEISKAAGVKIRGGDVSEAAKLMISRYLQDNGGSDEEVSAMMDAGDFEAAGGDIDAQFGGE